MAKREINDVERRGKGKAGWVGAGANGPSACNRLILRAIIAVPGHGSRGEPPQEECENGNCHSDGQEDPSPALDAAGASHDEHAGDCKKAEEQGKSIGDERPGTMPFIEMQSVEGANDPAVFAQRMGDHPRRDVVDGHIVVPLSPEGQDFVRSAPEHVTRGQWSADFFADGANEGLFFLWCHLRWVGANELFSFGGGVL